MGNHGSRLGSSLINFLWGKPRSEKFEQFTGLPDDLARQVFNASYISLKDKVALAQTSKRYYGLFRDHIHAAKCLMLVAHGEQEAANKMLRENPRFLLERHDVTDYSGRTFKNITPYEYAYWAKDTHMCRMLESHMDEATKAKMLERIDAIERDGLTYWQHGDEVTNSKHFDFAPLITALRSYIEMYDNWLATGNLDALKDAWMEVGIAQRGMPVHVVNEYCHPDRTFHPRPEFNEGGLPRNIIYNYSFDGCFEWFPLVISGSSGLGVNFVMMRGGCGKAERIDRQTARLMAPYAEIDLAAVSHLDEIRTADLTRSRDNLLPADLESGHSMRIE